MTTQQTDIEKTLKRILARELKEWPNYATHAVITKEISHDNSAALAFTKRGAPIWDSEKKDFSILAKGCAKDVFWLHSATIHSNFGLDASPENIVTRAEWEADRALLASEQAQPLGDSEEFDQALWDKVASNAIPSFLQTSEEWTSDEETFEPMESWSDIAKGAAQLADAFMAERAKRIAARNASHD
jgi:hypothetical protein